MVASQGSVSAGAPLLRMENISKRFGGAYALRGVSISVGAGEIIGLIGENGAGKSTLMKTLGGVHNPDEGQLFVDNKPVTIRSARDASALGIGFIHQELNVLDNLDVAANVFLGRELTKGGPLALLDRPAMVKQTNEYLARLQVAGGVHAETPVASLALAQKQLIEIARALSLNARILIFDEPTSSLTLSETQSLLALIKELRDTQNVSIIYISHRLGEIEEIADRVVGLRDGQNAGELSKSEITQPAMVKLMVGRDIAPPHASDNKRAEASAPRLRAENLRTPRYPEKPVSFDLYGGEVLGFAGLVGAGRTEIARALFGVEPATGGTITLDGETTRINKPKDAIGRGLYLIPEDRRRDGLILDMAIQDNITLPGLSRFASAIGIVRRDKEADVAKHETERLKLRSASGRLDAPAGTLSGGNQQKIVLAKWLALSPKILIFDEPTRGVDVGAKAEIYAIMRQLAESGVAVMMISSDMEEVLALSDRIAVMHEGRITGILEQGEFGEEAIMRLAVGGGSAGKKDIAAVENTPLLDKETTV